MQMADPGETTMTQFERSGAFAGRCILITGGSRGIAAAIALGLAEQGADVCVSHSEKHDAVAGFAGSAQKFADGISAGGGRAVAIDRDMGEPGAGRELAGEAVQALGKIDSLVLSASVQIEKPLSEQSNADLELQYRMNLTANIELLNAFLPSMADRGFGRVLAIGSAQEILPSPRMPVYAMTKAALSNLILNLAREYAPKGVTLNTLSPGLIATDRNTARRADPAAWAQIQETANPMRRAGTAQEIAPSALHLLSEKAGFITGANLFATGGAHIGRANSAVSRTGDETRGQETMSATKLT